MDRVRMDIVIVGHVDHGKSTVVGRLLADTGTLPDGKLESIRAYCAKNSRPFEYAFLLDALKDEQAQGITIDTARTFFKSDRRDYVIIDAPGHIEFLKNMVTGAARAEAAVLVIDAKEGIRENSKRHGYLLSMLGIRQMAVAVNKMDLVDYSRQAFEDIRDEYIAFLARIGAVPQFFLPIAAFPGENMVKPSAKMPWYKGPDLLAAMDAFEKAPPKDNQPLRLPVQDVYKFTAQGDERRIISGRVESGTLHKGDEVVFLPSGKKSRIESIEGFNTSPRDSRPPGWSTGVTLSTQVFVGRGEILARTDKDLPQVSNRIRANIFWMGKAPLRMGRDYLLKLGTAKVPMQLHHINYLIDAAEDGREHDQDHVARHDVADCVLQLRKPLAFDLASSLEATGRFVIVDQYEIAGGGIIREALQSDPETIEKVRQEHKSLWRKGPGGPGAVAFLTGTDPVLDQAAEILSEKPKWVFLKITQAGDNSSFEDYKGSLSNLGIMTFGIGTAGSNVLSRVETLDLSDARFLESQVSPLPHLWVRPASEANLENIGGNTYAFKPSMGAVELAKEIEDRLLKLSQPNA